jgi:hypothetical protein
VKWSGAIVPSWAIRAAKGMWYQVVSPPNMPASRLSWAGKVHSAIAHEATPKAVQKASLETWGAAISALPGALLQPSQAARRPVATQPAIVQPSVRMPSVPSSCRARISSAVAIVTSARRASAPENSGTIQRRSQ